jgi:hypothetical protein
MAVSYICHVFSSAGQEATIAAPAEAAQSTKHTSDLLRRWKEYATSFKEGLKAEPLPMSDDEVALRNEKIKIDEFQEKIMAASRKVCHLANPGLISSAVHCSRGGGTMNMASGGIEQHLSRVIRFPGGRS